MNEKDWKNQMRGEKEEKTRKQIKQPRGGSALPYKLKRIPQINGNKLVKIIKSMKPEDFPAYSNLLKQFHQYKKKAIILELIQLIADNWNTLVE